MVVARLYFPHLISRSVGSPGRWMSSLPRLRVHWIAVISVSLFCLVYPRRLGIPRASHKAINRWFVAVTLTRNPSLIQYRRQECRGAKTVVHLESVNVDFSDLVHTADEVLSTAQ